MLQRKSKGIYVQNFFYENRAFLRENVGKYLESAGRK